MSLSLPRPLPLPVSLPLPICSALLCSALSIGFVTLALLLLFWLREGVGRVVLWSGKCKWQWRMVTVTATETKRLSVVVVVSFGVGVVWLLSQLNCGRWCGCDSIPGI